MSIVILDGGTGMALKELGHSSLDDDPLWSAAVVKTHPEDIVKLHRQFYKAGSQFVVTATYQASADGYKKRFSVDDTAAFDLIKQGVTLAKRARDEHEKETGQHLYVAASVGPYGATLCDFSEYHGRHADSMSIQELSEWHLPRMAAILETGPDLLAIETIPVLKEAKAILNNLASLPDIKVWLTFQCKDGISTGHGESIVDAVRLAASYKSVVATGVNCVHPKHVSSLLQQISLAKLDIPVIVKPNGGFFDHDGSSSKKWILADHIEEWVNLGAKWIGGCCHIYDKDIAEVCQALVKSQSICLAQNIGQLL